MRNVLLAAAAATLAITSPAAAQSAQERLDARYDRALAAGYKALMLCSAIGNAGRNGTLRTPESVHEWELSGIQAPLDDIVRELPFRIIRTDAVTMRKLVEKTADSRNLSIDTVESAIDPRLLDPDEGRLLRVEVTWADDMPPRVAGRWVDGCTIMPIGWENEPYELDANDFFNRLKLQPLPPFQEANEPDFAAGLKAFDAKSFGEGTRTTAVLVIENNDPVFEAYTDGFGPATPQRTWSVAKSIAATVVGEAVQRGKAAVDQPIRTLLTPNSNDPRRAITLDHALRMASGRYSDTAGNRTDPIYWGGSTVLERALTWPVVHKPGTVFRYANNDTLLAIKAIEPELWGHEPAKLFERLGMTHTVAEDDWQANYILSSQVWSTARDLATLGQLYLNDGVWNGERILPENWREYVSDPSGPQPEGTQWGYGAGWWTFRRPEGNAFEGIPDDAFAARGNRGQYVVVVPSRNVVIVRRGEDMVGTRFDIAAFTRDVLAALEEK